MEFFDKNGNLLRGILKFPSSDNGTMILFKEEHELAMGGPLLGIACLLLKNGALFNLDGTFGDKVLWQAEEKYVALVKWHRSEEGRHINHRVCILDVQGLQIGEFEEPIFIKQFTQFKDNTIECEYSEKHHTKVFVGKLQNLKFKSICKQNEA